MAKLRHIAMQVPDLEKAAQFYERVFGMVRVTSGETPYGNAQMMSDGGINLALLNFPEGTIGGRDEPCGARGPLLRRDREHWICGGRTKAAHQICTQPRNHLGRLDRG